MNAFTEWLKKTFPPKNHVCDKDPGIDALLIVIRLVSKVSKTSLAAVKGSITPVAVAMAVGGLIPDVAKLISEYDDIPCELKSLEAGDYEELVKAIMLEFGFEACHAKDVLDTAISLVSDVMRLSPEVRAAITEITSAVLH